jgi:hypothetical protein
MEPALEDFEVVAVVELVFLGRHGNGLRLAQRVMGSRFRITADRHANPSANSPKKFADNFGLLAHNQTYKQRNA